MMNVERFEHWQIPASTIELKVGESSKDLQEELEQGVQ